MKTCISCGVEREESLFPTGRNQCKPCRAAYTKHRKQMIREKVEPVVDNGFVQTVSREEALRIVGGKWVD